MMNYNQADFKASYGLFSQLPDSDRPELVFSGRSNVGKSSVINRLLGRKNFAHVGATPGKHPRLIILSWTARHIWWICRVTVMPRYPRKSGIAGGG